jgi:DNA polymerase gamma 1
VDVDKVFRKEVTLTCVTPSNTTPIPPGESLDIYQVAFACPSLRREMCCGS